MIVLVTGPPGNGKSFYAVRKIARALCDGKYVATNVELAPDWADQVAGAALARRLVPGARARRSALLRRRVVVSEDLETLLSIRLEGSKEGRGVMVLDEAHNWMNSREWSAADRKQLVRFFTQHRKLGWDIYLIAQDAEMLDKQVRTLFEYHVHLRNLRRAKVLGVPLLPFNFFLAVWRWHTSQNVVMKRETFRLDWSKNLYSTMQLSHGLVGDDVAGIRLPLPAE